METKLKDSLLQISHELGTVNFSSHTQMRNAIEAGLEISDATLLEYDKHIKLIDAAPEMFNALKTILEIYESEGQLLSFDVNIVREVLKKATE